MKESAIKPAMKYDHLKDPKSMGDLLYLLSARPVFFASSLHLFKKFVY